MTGNLTAKENIILHSAFYIFHEVNGQNHL